MGSDAEREPREEAEGLRRRQRSPRRRRDSRSRSRSGGRRRDRHSRRRRSPSDSRDRDRRRRRRRRSSSRSRSASPRRRKVRGRGRGSRGGGRDERRRRRSESPAAGSPGRSGAGSGSEGESSRKNEKKNEKKQEEKKKMTIEELFNAPGRTGGVYIPPFKLKKMKAAMKDKASKEYQKMTWVALRKSLNGLINKVNTANIANILPELFSENLVRGRGLFVRAVMKAQLASPGFTHIYGALVAVVNTKLPEIGELLLKRVIVQFRRAFKRNNKIVAVGVARFIAHLVNYQVAHEILALQLLTLLLEKPTDDSVEVACNFVKECGMLLSELTPQGLHAIFERFRSILHEGDIDKRVQYTIESLFAVRKSGFADHPSVHPDLDLVESEDQITHEIGLDDELDKEELLDVFRFDPEYEKNEALWGRYKADILGEEEDSDSSESGSEGDDESGSASESESEGEGGEAAAARQAQLAALQQKQVIEDHTGVDVVNLRRTIYLTIMSSLDFEECVHKIMKLRIPEGSENEVCTMLIECCSQERTYLRYYGLLAQRFCEISTVYQDKFDEAFAHQYSIIHRLETNKLRNVGKFFAHLLCTDALPWTVFEYIQMSEEETTSSSRIFIKIILLELSDHMGLVKLRDRFNDPYMAETFAGMFPRSNPRNTRFAINFYSAIGLGPLTDGLREHIKNAPKMIMQQAAAMGSDSDSDSDSDSSSSSSSSSSSGSSSSGSDSDSSSSSGSDSDSSDSDSD